MTDATMVAIITGACTLIGVIAMQVPATIIAMHTSEKADKVVKKADEAVVRADKLMTTADTIAAATNGNLTEMKALHAETLSKLGMARQEIESMKLARELAKENTESAVQAALAIPTHTESKPD